MSEPRDPDAVLEDGGDYSYDLAHDVPAADSSRPEPAAAQEAPPVDVAGDDLGGDYSYDLAHEVPRSTPPTG